MPPADVPSDPGVVPATDDDAAAPTSTTPASPAPTPPTTTPPAAIATTTTTPPTTAPAVIATTTVPPTTTPPAAIATTAAALAATAPRSPVATPGNTTVKLTWLAPSSNGGAAIDKYLVQRATSAAGPWANVAFATTLSYTNSGLANGSHYYFRVLAHNSAGYSPASTTVNAVPRTVASAPRSPVATAGNTTVKLTWLAPSSNGGAAIDKYLVQRATSAAGPWANVAFATTPTYTNSGLTNGTHYYFRILAHNTAGYSPASTTVNAIPRTVASAPLSAKALPDNGFVWLSWKAPSSTGGAAIDQYVVQRSSNGTTGWANAAYSNGSLFTAQAPWLTNGTTYYFRILAHNAAGWGAPSTVVSATPRTVPDPPQSCSASQASYGSMWIVVTWQPPPSDGGAAITTYEISVWSNGQFHAITTVPNNPQHVGVIQVGAYGGFDVRVRALNTAGYGAACWTSVYMWS